MAPKHKMTLKPTPKYKMALKLSKTMDLGSEIAQMGSRQVLVERS